MKAYLLLILAAIFYAGNLIVGKPVAQEIPPITLSFLRYIVAVLVIIPFGYREWKNNKDLWKKEWKAILALSATGLVLFNIFVYLALNYTTSINAGIVEGTAPIFTLILTFIIFNERFSRKQMLGVFISLFGVFFVITKGSWEIITNLQFNSGDLIMILAMITWAFYSIFIKQHTWKFPTYGALLVMAVVSIIIFIPLMTIEMGQIGSIDWSWEVISGLLYLGIFPSLIALLAYNKGIEAIGPSRASVFLNLIPVFTMIGAVIFLEEQLTWVQVIGSLFVIFGVLITNRVKVNKQ
ncbi:Permease of the drug/metabolite transporter (DMT) superfamily [Gracilibacillus orientalis]|uniref:Permease of the drug/metabolite transporter (DMT) superfamily n=1 Tax=Gracilibacillus orientalis TaxID=334253 RepID=A0A1I4RHP1_9BACI|nr:DMT family transporter [Gracilibacillus orientalis]SFM51802.1 Permease of the drug/metabolite transporter (DMT) superfamily [Gracilibacillus orientalis]